MTLLLLQTTKLQEVVRVVDSSHWTVAINETVWSLVCNIDLRPCVWSFDMARRRHFMLPVTMLLHGRNVHPVGFVQGRIPSKF